MFTKADRLYFKLRLDAIDRKLNSLLKRTQTEDIEMGALTDAVAKLADKVQGMSSVVDGVETTLDGLREQLETQAGELDAAGESETAAKLTALADALEENKQRIAIAIARNTDANDEAHVAQM